MYRHLVLGGGGMGGLCYLSYLETIWESCAFQTYCGVSVGALLAFLLAIGYTPTQLKAMLLDIPLDTYLNDPTESKLHQLCTKFGLYSGKPLMNLLKTWVNGPVAHPCLGLGSNGRLVCKDLPQLRIVGSNLSTGKSIVFGADTTPDMSIWTALRISMGVPLFFTAVKYRNQYYIDGELFVQYNNLIHRPLTLFLYTRLCQPDTDGQPLQLYQYIHQLTFHLRSHYNRQCPIALPPLSDMVGFHVRADHSLCFSMPKQTKHKYMTSPSIVTHDTQYTYPVSAMPCANTQGHDFGSRWLPASRSLVDADPTGSLSHTFRANRRASAGI